MNDRPDNNQLVVSYKLILLLQWLTEHEHHALKKLITKALQEGLSQEFVALQAATADDLDNDVLQQNIINFFELLEQLIYQIYNEEHIKEVIQRSMIPALDHLDTALVKDMQALEVSIAKATSAISDKPGKNAKEVLCKELLKNWKPQKNLVLN